VQIVEIETPSPEARTKGEEETKGGKGTKGTGSQKETGAQNRKRGRPPKRTVVNTPSVADEFSSESIVKRVQRTKIPGKQQTSPYRPF